MQSTSKRGKVFKLSPVSQRKSVQSVSLGEIPMVPCSNLMHDAYSRNDVNLWSVWLRTCEQEIVDPIAGTTTGKVPQWLVGSLIRNGPGAITVGKESFQHLFDCPALLHRFNISEGTVTYQNRFVRTETYKANRKANRIVFTDFGTAAVPDPCRTIFDRIHAVFSPKMNPDNTMISVYPFGDELYAFGETPIIYRINDVTLATEQRQDVSEHVGIVHQTSHPHVLPDGTVFNLAMSVNAIGQITHNIVKFPAKDIPDDMFNNATKVASIPSRWAMHPSYMHSFGITENYFVIVEQPFTLSVPKMIYTKLNNKPLIGSFRSFPEQYTKFSIVSRKSGKLVKTLLSETFFYFHIVNQFEDKDCIVIDIFCYKDPLLIQGMYIDVMKNMQKNSDFAKMFRGRPLRFVLPMNVTNEKIIIKPELLCDLGCELPCIHYEKYLGKKYRYFYAISSDVGAEYPGAIIKVDTLRKTRKTWCEPNCYPSEPVFVPNPNPKREDDGVILSALVWGQSETNKVGLVVLNGRTLQEMSRTVFEASSPIPKCFHGWFINKFGN